MSSTLAFLALSTIGSSYASSSVDLEKVKANFLELKAKFHEKHHMPLTLSSKLEKFTKMKFQPLKQKLDDLVFDDTTESNLRGLKIKNNFFTITGYVDSICTEEKFTMGELVNYCNNIKYPSSNEVGSYLIKVNKKENLVVELLYDAENCKGIPSKATNILLPYTSFTGLDTCFQQYFTYDDDTNDDDDGDGIENIKMSYISTYPSVGTQMFITQVYPESYCSEYHTYYSSYSAYPISTAKGVDICYTEGGWSYIFSTAACSIDGQFYYYYYDNPTCDGVAYYTSAIFEVGCVSVVNGDDNGDDDDGYFYQTGVLETNYCT